MTHRLRRFTLLVGWASVAAVLLAQAGCQPVASAPATHELDALVARCVEAMTRDVCVAQRDSAAANSSPAASQVFVAGVGAIDAQAYSEIRSSGEAMCSLVKSRCTGGWNDSACQTARSIWPTAGKG